MTLLTRLRSTLCSRVRFHSLAIVATTVVGASTVVAGKDLTSSPEQTIRSVEGIVARNLTGSERDGMARGDVRAGKKLFQKHCATCHGSRVKGDGARIIGATVADLSSPSSQQKLDLELLETIHEGRSGKAMPSWKGRLSEPQAKDVLAYIRTLAQ